WYDAEGNYDAEASGLNEDGTFKYNTTYKVAISVALDEGTAGRLAPYTFKTSVYTGTVYEDAIMHYDTSGAPTDAVYAYPKTATEPLTKYEATFTAKAGDNGLTFPLDPAPSNAANHFALSSFGFKDAETGSYVGTNLLEDGKSYIFEVTFKAEDGYVFKNGDFTVTFNGETVSDVEIYGVDNYVDITYPFTLGGGSGTGVTVSGTATSFNSETDDVIIQLIESGASEAAYETIVHGNSASYSIAGVAPGTYTMKVMKTKHAPREYTVIVGTSDVTQNAEIWLYGDVTADGLVNSTDATQINRYFSGKTSVFGSKDSDTESYRLIVADVYSKDNTINATDATQIKRHFSGKSSVFTDFA
ncbi:MAG: dockerin type I repeat-containing protein, partial [Faecousia sp.]